MKNLFNKEKLHPFDFECINQRLKSLELQVFKLECQNRSSFDKSLIGNTDVHSQIIKEVSHYINSVEVIPNSKYSFTINITIK